MKWPFYEQFSSAKPNKAQGPGALQTSCSAVAKLKKKKNPTHTLDMDSTPSTQNPPQGKQSFCKLLTFVADHRLLLKIITDKKTALLVVFWRSWQLLSPPPDTNRNPGTSPPPLFLQTLCRIPLLTARMQPVSTHPPPLCSPLPLLRCMTALSQRWIHRQHCSQNK